MNVWALEPEPALQDARTINSPGWDIDDTR